MIFIPQMISKFKLASKLNQFEYEGRPRESWLTHAVSALKERRALSRRRKFSCRRTHLCVRARVHTSDINHRLGRQREPLRIIRHVDLFIMRERVSHPVNAHGRRH